MIPLLLAVIAYLIGSIPFGVLIGYVVLRRDIRAGGSGHSGGTNTIRQAGWLVGTVVIALDVAKGAFAMWLALVYGDGLWAPMLAAGAVVAGHCWPLFAGFRGGMGLVPAGGVMALAYPAGFVGAFGLLLLAAFILRQSARSIFAAGVLGPPLIWLFSQAVQPTAIAASAGLVLAVRALSDWNRKQKAVWDIEKRN